MFNIEFLIQDPNKFVRFFNCSDLFTPTITDEGMCCSFNIMPEGVMFRTNVVSCNSI